MRTNPTFFLGVSWWGRCRASKTKRFFEQLPFNDLRRPRNKPLVASTMPSLLSPNVFLRDTPLGQSNSFELGSHLPVPHSSTNLSTQTVTSQDMVFDEKDPGVVSPPSNPPPVRARKPDEQSRQDADSSSTPNQHIQIPARSSHTRLSPFLHIQFSNIAS